MVDRKTSAPTHHGPRDERGVTADRVLETARSLFASRGYAATSMRQVAYEAGVDAALVSYYFKNKAGLLDAALTLPESFASTVSAASSAPIEVRGRALVKASLAAWEDPTTANVLRSAILAAAQEPLAMEKVRVIYSARFLHVVAINLPDRERQVRAGLVACQMLGLAMTRYVWRVGIFTELSPEEICDLVAPIVQACLTDPLQDTLYR